jgi:hypothetical protein
VGIANVIHASGQAIVCRGPQETAEHYWEQLKGAGLTMAPLEQGRRFGRFARAGFRACRDWWWPGTRSWFPVTARAGRLLSPAQQAPRRK